MKRTFLMVIVSIVVLSVIAAYNTSVPKTKKDTASLNKSTCINGFNSLKAAKFQKKMLDQQVLLSAAAGRGEEAMAVGVQVSELNGIIVIFEDLIADPKLGCHNYLKDEPKVTRKTI